MLAFKYTTVETTGIVLAVNESDARERLATSVGEPLTNLIAVCKARYPDLKTSGLWASLPLAAKETLIDDWGETVERIANLLDAKENELGEREQQLSKLVSKSADLAGAMQQQAGYLRSFTGLTPQATVREERVARNARSQNDANAVFDSIFDRVIS